MKKHTQVYFDAFGYDKDDPTTFIPSEISEDKAVDLHHIVTREDIIENLMYLTREEHEDYGDKTEYMAWLLKIHRRRLQLANITFNNDWFEFYINKYEALSEQLNLVE